MEIRRAEFPGVLLGLYVAGRHGEDDGNQPEAAVKLSEPPFGAAKEADGPHHRWHSSIRA